MNILAHAPYIGTTGYNSHTQNFFRRLSKFHNLKIRNCTVGKNWKGLIDSNQYPHGNDVDELDKSLLGLQTLWNEKGELQDYQIHNFDNELFKPDVNIVLADVGNPYFYENYKGRKIAYTVWENTKYPDDFFIKLQKFDEVWVPSKWQADITVNQGIHFSKVKIVPEGIDETIFYPKKQKKYEKFTFAMFGRWEARKSTKEIIRIFKKLFGKNKNVQLIISVDNPYATDDLNSTENRLKKYNLECENIKILHFPNQNEYIDILQSCHVFLSCSRSEGWNLPLIEAIACGIPSFYSNCSGQLEFAIGKGVPINILSEVSPLHSKKDYLEIENNICGSWYEPDFKDLEQKMFHVFANYESYQNKALEDSKKIREEFSWEKSVVIANEILERKNKFTFITCGNEKYMPLIEKLVKSIQEFSKAKIIVYGVDCDVPFNYPCLIKRKLNVPTHSIYDKWYWKQYACIESLKEDFENFIWIDGDVIVNFNIDNIEKNFLDIDNYPIPDIHRNEEFFGSYTFNEQVCNQSFNQNLCEHLKINKNLPMAHVCMYIYNKNCKWWFEEIINIYKSINLNEYQKFLLWNDEGIDNALRWKFNFRKYLPLSNFDTSGYDGDLGQTNSSLKDFYDFWNKFGPNNFGRVYGYQYIPENKSSILYFHGNKNLVFCDEMINYVKYKKNNSFYKSEMFFTEENVLKNFGEIKNIEGSTLEIASKFGWDYAIYHEIFNLQDYYINRKKTINSGDIVVDLGANIGIFNRWAYDQGASKVISFEPDKRYFKLLSVNADNRSILFNAAVTNNVGETSLYESEHLGGSTLLNPFLHNKYKVRTYTLNYLFESGIIDYINFLKIDVEGSEHLVFQGVSDENLIKIKNISLEYHHDFFNHNDNLRNSLINRFKNIGFSSYLLYLGYDNNLQYIYFTNENFRRNR
jgi:FkbM family methyltransferase